MLADRIITPQSTPSSPPAPTWFSVNPASGPANDRPAASGDPVAVLYARHRGAVRARCRQLLRNAAAAEDALQETFTRVLRHAHHLPPEAEALPWLYRIATNYCLNELRHLRIASTVEMDDEPLRDTPPSPEERVSHRQMVRKVLAPIPAKLRDVGLLRHVDGMLDSEIAAALGVSRRTVVYRLLAFRQRAAADVLRVNDGDGDQSARIFSRGTKIAAGFSSSSAL